MTARARTKQVRTTLLIPCYNEVDGIYQLCTHLRTLTRKLRADGEVEILFIDDGSFDGTAAAIEREARGLPYRVVTHERNRGIGAALRTGFAASNGEEIVTMDSDCTYDPMKVPELLEALRGGAKIVTGSPYHPLGEVVGVQGWRLVLSKGLSRLYWLILPQRLYTYTSCFRAYRRDILQSLSAPDDGFLGVTQFLVSGILNGYRIEEIPTRLTKRRFGQSKIRVLRVIMSHLRYLAYVAGVRVAGQSR